MKAGVVDKDFERRLRLNSAIVKNRYWVLPVDDEGVENFMPVGRGVPSNKWCGEHRGLLVCKNVAGHKGVVFKGSDASGKVFVRNQHFWCKRSSCPICFISGWSVRRGKAIEARVNEGVKRGFGQVEHIVVSFPPREFGLWYDVLHSEALKMCGVYDVSGGCLIFHGFRIDRERNVLVWSPHFHVLGFIHGGYTCRDCIKGVCDWESCDGFEARVRRGFQKVGRIVKVTAERETVYGSAWYQMHHSTIKLGIKRFHTITWFGNCGFRKFKTPKSFAGVPCKLCGDDMSRGVHIGKRDIVKNVGHPAYKSAFLDDEFGESGEPNYFDVH